MPDLIRFLDPAGFAIVVFGTLAATLLRCGWSETRAMLAALGQLGRKGFAAGTARAELAAQVNEIRSDGMLRAQPHLTGDAEFDEASDVLARSRSVAATLAAHERHKARRAARADTAVRWLAQAAELAPVFGMVGTLAALSRLPAHAGGDFSGAISMAVLTTLYGLLFANLLFAPLARAVERHAAHEERERQALIDWLAAQVALACPQAGAFDRRGQAA